MQIGIEELETNVTEIVQRVHDEGEAIDITSHGEVIARLIPAPKASAKNEELEDLMRDLDEIGAEIASQQTGTFSAVDLVREMRRE